AKIFAFRKQQIESEKNQAIRLALRNRRLQGGEIRIAFMIERNDLAVDHDVGQRSALFGNRLELAGPVEALACSQNGLAVLDPHLHAIAVEFDLVAPA